MKTPVTLAELGERAPPPPLLLICRRFVSPLYQRAPRNDRKTAAAERELRRCSAPARSRPPTTVDKMLYRSAKSDRKSRYGSDYSVWSFILQRPRFRGACGWADDEERSWEGEAEAEAELGGRGGWAVGDLACNTRHISEDDGCLAESKRTM